MALGFPGGIEYQPIAKAGLKQCRQAAALSSYQRGSAKPIAKHRACLTPAAAPKRNAPGPPTDSLGQILVLMSLWGKEPPRS
jgi:hypothetical protein